MLPFEKPSANNFSTIHLFQTSLSSLLILLLEKLIWGCFVLTLAQMYLVQQQRPKSGEEELAGRTPQSSDEIEGPKVMICYRSKVQDANPDQRGFEAFL